MAERRFNRIKLEPSGKKANPTDLFNPDPETAQKLHELRSKIPIIYDGAFGPDWFEKDEKEATDE